MKRRSHRTAVAVVLASVFLSRCLWSPPRGSFHERVLNAADRGAGTVDLDVSRERQWDRAYFFAPYTPPHVINRVLGFPCKVCPFAELERRDDMALLVLVKQQKEVRVEELPREDIEVSVRLLNRPFAPSTVFRIREANGRVVVE